MNFLSRILEQLGILQPAPQQPYSGPMPRPTAGVDPMREAIRLSTPPAAGHAAPRGLRVPTADASPGILAMGGSQAVRDLPRLGLPSAEASPGIPEQPSVARFRPVEPSKARQGQNPQMGVLPAPTAVSLLRQFESFRETPYWDVNAHRIGYGSDTITSADGKVSKVVPGSKVSREDAERDLARRTAEFEAGARSKVGQEWDLLPEGARAALTSVAYNYGSIPDRLVPAIKSGDTDAIASAVEGLADDNDGINAGRRQKEAEVIRGSSSLGSSNAPVGTPMFPGDGGALAGITIPEDSPLLAGVKLPGFLGKAQNWINGGTGPVSRSDKLLAIGTGLLSGDDWASGAASVGENLMGLSQQAKEDGMSMADMQMDQEYRDAVLAQDQQRIDIDKSRADREVAGKTGRWYDMGAVQLPDGTVTTGFTTDSGPGIFDSNGNRLPTETFPINRGRAGGDKGVLSSSEYNKNSQELSQMDNDIAALDRTIGHVQSLDASGISREMTGLSSAWKSVLGQGLSPEEINQRVARGELQGLVGALRESVVGGGVMTEQDAQRIIMRMGGDLSSMIDNPQVILEQLRTLRAEREAIFNDRIGRFNTQIEDSGVEGYVPYTSRRTPSVSGGALSTGNTTPTPTGPSDDELRRMLTEDGLM